MFVPTLIALLSAQPTHPVLPIQEEPRKIEAAVTKEALLRHVKKLSGIPTRIVGSPGAETSAKYVRDELSRSGAQPLGEGYLKAHSLIQRSYSGPPKLVFELESGETYSGLCGIGFDLTSRGRVLGTEMLAIRAVSLFKQEVPEADPKSAIFIEGSVKRRNRVLKENGLRDLRAFGLELEAHVDKRHAKEGTKERTPISLLLPETAIAEVEGGERVTLRGDLLRSFVELGPSKVQLVVASSETEIPAYNVIASFKGEGTEEKPELADEFVIVAARYLSLIHI